MNSAVRIRPNRDSFHRGFNVTLNLNGLKAVGASRQPPGLEIKAIGVPRSRRGP
jgi:hypothetical protein